MAKTPKPVKPKPRHDWYFREWCGALQIRFPHAWLQDKVGYSDGKASNVLTGKKRYDRDIVNEVAAAMSRQPYELLMHPDEAFAIIRLREAGRAIVATTEKAAEAAPEPIRRKAS